VRAARGLILLAAALLFPSAAARGQVPFTEAPRALIFVVDGLSYQDALNDPVVAAVALSGGVGLMTPTVPPDELRGDLRALADGRSTLLFPTSPGNVGEAVRHALGENSEAGRTLVLIVVPEPSAEMRARTGGITPVVMGTGTPELESSGVLRGLTSETTRREGIVSNVDVVPTVRDFHGQPMNATEAGAPMTVTERTPTELLRRYGEYREVVRPVGLAVLALALAALGVALLLLLGPWSNPGVARAAATVGLLAIAFQVALLPASWLPAYEPGVVWPVLGLVGAALALASWVAGRRSPYLAVTVVAGAGLALVAVDAALGWPSLLTPLLGGSALEGTRFYGLGNPYAGMVLAGAVLVAAVLRPWAGVVLLLAAALFAGLPWLGADLGGGITLFAVAALWWALRVRESSAPAAILAAIAAAVIGAVVLVLVQRLAPEADHVTRAVEQADGLPGILGAFSERLALNLETTARTPAVWLALIGVPVWLVVAWTRAGPFRPSLEAAPAWRDALVTLAVGGILGYVLNDTYGMAGVAFIYLSLGAVYPALVLGPWTRSASSPAP
jgi:hypothetical protein